MTDTPQNTPRAGRRARLALGLACVLVLLLGTATVVYRSALDEQRGPDVALGHLLLPRPAEVDGDPEWTVHGSRPDVREWHNNGRAPSLVQGARRHDSVWRAEWAFRFDSPKDGLGDAEVPAGISAHAADLSCVGAKEPGCTVWVFWARYGQYTVYLEYISLGAGVPYARFEAHVREVDKVVSRALQGTR